MSTTTTALWAVSPELRASSKVTSLVGLYVYMLIPEMNDAAASSLSHSFALVAISPSSINECHEGTRPSAPSLASILTAAAPKYNQMKILDRVDSDSSYDDLHRLSTPRFLRSFHSPHLPFTELRARSRRK